MSDNSGSNEEPKLQSLQDIMTSDFAIAEYKYRLPPEFFQKVLDCEVDLKEKFDPKIFFELINYYSKAIEYYESISDPKFIIYNQALNFLFEQPEAKKFMEGKDLGKEFRKKEIIKRFKQSEKVVTEEKVKVFIEKKISSESIKNSIDNLYNKDIDKQKNSFKKKMEEKRLKYNDKYQNREKAKNKDVNIINDNEMKLSQEKENNMIDNNKDDEKNKENDHQEKEDEDVFKFEGGEGVFNIDDVEEQEEISEIDFNIDDVMEFVNIAKEENKENKNENNNDNNNKKEEKSDLKEEPKANIKKNDLLLQKSIKMTNKTRFFEKIKDCFDDYFKGYYEYFINNNIDLIIKEFEDNEIEISQKVNKSGLNIFAQIKDMEYLLENKDTEDSYKKEIENIINQLKEEEKNNIEKILSENDEKLKKTNSKYLINNSILKEKFKLNTTKLLNSFIFK